MDASFFLKGLIIGFSIAAPVGPIGILCIRRTLASGRITGLLSGLGAATADAFYGSIAAFGLTFISSFLIQQQTWLRLVGGAFLCYLGIRTVLSKPVDVSITGSPASLLNAYASTFLLTLTNPLTILSFAAIFAGFGLAAVRNSYPSAGLMVLGVFLGSSSWWLILSSLTGWLKSRLNLAALTWIHRLSGLILLGFGLASMIGIWFRM
jgi:threonine/homoserine/homoserine lactone efflux protein